ncbi:MAG: biotin/lipoyl-binding protein, partial [Bacteroidales bacterium]|jgi:biotin carboxyl carrier protein|nr:biotin/lipoyl-binding protein [Bacteroidales bacterium]MDD4640126.1 biotin/lipoyl-binding protein [Bacteroidales bacterium]
MKEFKYKIHGSLYKVEVIKDSLKGIELEVNGTPYTVEIERPEKIKSTITRPAAAPLTSQGTPVVAQPKSKSAGGAVKSPLPGVILEVNVKLGDEVKIGSKLLVLEAMKMENTIASDRDGKVLEIKVDKGASVLEGADLVIIG